VGQSQSKQQPQQMLVVVVFAESCSYSIGPATTATEEAGRYHK
jgi:hypothetical protein